MTDEEMLQALIHIKRHIYSKPIKLYINSVIRRIKLAQLKHKFTAGMYKVEFEAPLYELKNPVKIDVVA
jgi:hypothetical protein